LIFAAGRWPVSKLSGWFLKNEVAGFELWRTTSMLVLFGFVFIGPTFCADFLHMLLKMLLGAQIDLKRGFGCHCGLAGSTEIRD
jgi:hypothetical protein